MHDLFSLGDMVWNLLPQYFLADAPPVLHMYHVIEHDIFLHANTKKCTFLIKAISTFVNQRNL